MVPASYSQPGGILGGIYIHQVFQGDTMDLRIEYADTDLRPAAAS